MQKDLSFDQLILECDKMLDIKSAVEKKFNNWRSSQFNIFKKILKMKNNKFFNFILRICPIRAFIVFSPIMILILFNIPFKIDAIAYYMAVFIASGVFFTLYKNSILKEKKICIEQGTDLSKCSSEELKLIFLKESFSDTINNLNLKLESIQKIINQQRDKHKKDKEEILRFKSMFKETGAIISKIDQSVIDLDRSYDKISIKKSELKASLDEYIGESGYISKKEREIKDLKIAQELSSRLSENFNETLEITKNVDVLTDTIIPGIEKLMSYKIPELIENIDIKSDTEKIILQEKISMIN